MHLSNRNILLGRLSFNVAPKRIPIRGPPEISTVLRHRDKNTMGRVIMKRHLRGPTITKSTHISLLPCVISVRLQGIHDSSVCLHPAFSRSIVMAADARQLLQFRKVQEEFSECVKQQEPLPKLAEICMKYWISYQIVVNRSECTITDLSDLFLRLAYETLEVLIPFKWSSDASCQIFRASLPKRIHAVRDSLRSRPFSAQIFLCCNRLCSILQEPWPESFTSAIGKGDLDSLAVISLLSEQGPRFVVERIRITLDWGNAGVALYLCRAVLRLMKILPGGSEPPDSEKRAKFCEELLPADKSFLLDVSSCLFILSEDTKKHDIHNLILPLSAEDSVAMAQRLLLYAQTYESSRKIWWYARANRVSEFICRLKLKISCSRTPHDLKTQWNLMKVLMKLRHFCGKMDDATLRAQFEDLRQSFKCSAPYYLLIECIMQEFGEPQRPYCVDLFIGALTQDISIRNSYKVHGSEAEVVHSEKCIAYGLKKLADVCSGDSAVCREALLTAFSLAPDEYTLVKMESLVEADQGARRKQLLEEAQAQAQDERCQGFRAHLSFLLLKADTAKADAAEADAAGADAAGADATEADASVTANAESEDLHKDHCNTCEACRKLWSSYKRLQRGNYSGALSKVFGSNVTCLEDYDENAAPCDLLDGQILQLSRRQCDDLVAVISYPRWHIFSWTMDWEKLRAMCRLYLEDRTKILNIRKELTFLELDASHYVKAEETDNPYEGIEAGYEKYWDAYLAQWRGDDQGGAEKGAASSSVKKTVSTEQKVATRKRPLNGGKQRSAEPEELKGVVPPATVSSGLCEPTSEPELAAPIKDDTVDMSLPPCPGVIPNPKLLARLKAFRKQPQVPGKVATTTSAEPTTTAPSQRGDQSVLGVNKPLQFQTEDPFPLLSRHLPRIPRKAPAPSTSSLTSSFEEKMRLIRKATTISPAPTPSFSAPAVSLGDKTQFVTAPVSSSLAPAVEERRQFITATAPSTATGVSMEERRQFITATAPSTATGVSMEERRQFITATAPIFTAPAVSSEENRRFITEPAPSKGAYPPVLYPPPLPPTPPPSSSSPFQSDFREKKYEPPDGKAAFLPPQHQTPNHFLAVGPLLPLALGLEGASRPEDSLLPTPSPSPPLLDEGSMLTTGAITILPPSLKDSSPLPLKDSTSLLEAALSARHPKPILSCYSALTVATALTEPAPTPPEAPHANGIPPNGPPPPVPSTAPSTRAAANGEVMKHPPSPQMPPSSTPNHFLHDNGVSHSSESGGTSSPAAKKPSPSPASSARLATTSTSLRPTAFPSTQPQSNGPVSLAVILGNISTKKKKRVSSHIPQPSSRKRKAPLPVSSIVDAASTTPTGPLRTHPSLPNTVFSSPSPSPVGDVVVGSGRQLSTRKETKTSSASSESPSPKATGVPGKPVETPTLSSHSRLSQLPPTVSRSLSADNGPLSNDARVQVSAAHP
ncbi:unnamed protein product, partial [Cyprideis torosa]